MEKIEDKWVITFSGGLIKVSGKELKDDVYLVKWICNDELVGEYELGSGNWGAYPLSLGHWRFEFHREGFDVEHYNHNLEKENILIIADLPPVLPGKTLPINKLIDRGNEIDDYAWGDTISPFESYFDPLVTLPISGIAKSDDMMYEGQCKYIATIYVLGVNEKFCNIRMMPNEAVCSDVMLYKSNIDHITFSRK